MNQYFMYGVLVSHDEYLDTKTSNTIEDVLKNTDDIQGIFTGRNGDFVIVGQVLRIVEKQTADPLIVPELTVIEEFGITKQILKKFGIRGEPHYYFIMK